MISRGEAFGRSKPAWPFGPHWVQVGETRSTEGPANKKCPSCRLASQFVVLTLGRGPWALLSGRIPRVLTRRAPLTVAHNTLTHSRARGALELVRTVVRGLDALALVASSVAGGRVGDCTSCAFAVAGAGWMADLLTALQEGRNAKSSTKAHHAQHGVRGIETTEPRAFALIQSLEPGQSATMNRVHTVSTCHSPHIDRRERPPKCGGKLPRLVDLQVTKLGLKARQLLLRSLHSCHSSLFSAGYQTNCGLGESKG